MKIILYLMIASSFLAADLFSINIRIMELSVFRISLFITTFLMILEYLKTNKKISLKFKSNQDVIIKFYFFWFIYALFSISWVKDYHSWLRAIFFIGSGFLCIWILSTYLKKEKNFRVLFIIICAMIFIHNIIGWSELLTGNYIFADLDKIDKYNQFSYNPIARVPVSMFGNVNDYATLLVFGVFISYIIFSTSKFKVARILGIINIVSSIYLISRTGSRANMLGLIIGIIVFLFLKYFKRINIKALLITIAIPILLLIMPGFIDNIIAIISNQLHFDFSTGSDFTRLNLIKNGLHFLKETIGFGTGAGNIEYWMETERIYYVGSIRNMHNWWVEILVGYGIVVFTGYIWVYFKMAKALYYSHINTKDRFIKNTSLVLLSIMTAFIITSVSSSSNISTEWLWLFWGVVIAYIGYVEKI
ncbi:O-antigen ligase family protein [Schnuerera sp. xch1]|uniref:O-antigen ligase family protein n=1 Tax=Schnuerera sp. xch1 TaxID=2874283 RepID=UPI001CBECFED|nr:O-antigen ligase family protein [Schnuerera sp. xch1]MBZ2174077.1 O-antigen ligase family protein [Schnuerera sp. xch1]